MTTIALLFVAASSVFDLPPGLLSAVCFVESGHNPGAHSPKDGGSPSYGICQIKYASAKQMGYDGTPEGLKDPKVNIYYAAAYLSRKLVLNGGDLIRAVAAYNSGTYRGDKKGTPVNFKYVRKVMTAWEKHV